MSFTGNEEHDFPLAAAAELTKNYRVSSPTGSTISHFFGKKAIQDILDQETCVGIRIYYALDVDGQKQLIVVGANASENDLFQGKLAERSRACPTMCSASNPLNS